MASCPPITSEQVDDILRLIQGMPTFITCDDGRQFKVQKWVGTFENNDCARVSIEAIYVGFCKELPK